MQIIHFTIAIHGGESEQEAMNKFLQSHHIVDTTRQFYSNGQTAFWCYSITYQQGKRPQGGQQQGRVDYKEVLKPEEFQVFDQLRKHRRTIGDKAGVPLFAVFTNEELAQMARARELNEASLKKIKGIGKSRIEKYGTELMQRYHQTKATDNEAGGQPDTPDS